MFIVCLFCLFSRDQSEKVDLLIKALIKEFLLCWGYRVYPSGRVRESYYPSRWHPYVHYTNKTNHSYSQF